MALAVQGAELNGRRTKTGRAEGNSQPCVSLPHVAARILNVTERSDANITFIFFIFFFLKPHFFSLAFFSPFPPTQKVTQALSTKKRGGRRGGSAARWEAAECVYIYIYTYIYIYSHLFFRHRPEVKHIPEVVDSTEREREREREKCRGKRSRIASPLRNTS